MTTQLDLFRPKIDTTEDLSRGSANPQSAAAHEELTRSGRLSRERLRVWKAISQAGPAGLSCREYAASQDVPMHKVSGRFTELKAHGKIVQKVDKITGKPVVRENSGVYVLK